MSYRSPVWWLQSDIITTWPVWMTPWVAVALLPPHNLKLSPPTNSVTIIHLRWIISVKRKDKGKLALNKNVLQICSKLPFFVYDNEVVEIVPWCTNDTHLYRLGEFCCCFNFQEIVKICLSTVGNQSYSLFQDFTDLPSVCESIQISSRWRCCQTYEIHSDACVQLSRSCDGFIGNQLPVQYVQSVGQGKSYTHQDLSSIHMDVPVVFLSFFFFFKGIWHLHHNKAVQTFGAANWWCSVLNQ